MKPIIETIQKQMTMRFEEGVMKAVQEVGIIVDKERLEKALYDAKSFYEEGYKDGAAANHEVVRCENCRTSREINRDDPFENRYIEECLWCSRHETAMFRSDFCSYGERRET